METAARRWKRPLSELLWIVPSLHSALLFVPFLGSDWARADVTVCDGVITNLPCEGKGAVLFSEKEHVPLSSEDQEKREKRRIVSALQSVKYRVERELGIPVDIGVVEAICNSGSVTECRSAAAEKERSVGELAALNARNNSEKGAESGPSGNSGGTQNTQSDSPQAVSIVVGEDYWNDRRRGRRGHWDRDDWDRDDPDRDGIAPGDNPSDRPWTDPSSGRSRPPGVGRLELPRRRAR